MKNTDVKENRVFFIVFCFDLQEIEEIRTNFEDNILNTRNKTFLKIAVIYDNCDVTSILLKNKFTIISKKMAKTAASNGENEKKMMTLLLEQRGADVMITKKMMKAAAENERNEKKVMTLLLEQRGANVMITEKMMKTAATCEQNEVLKIIEENFKISFFKKKWSIAQFYNAAKFEYIDTTQKLLTEKVKPDLKNLRHVSPF